MDLVNYNVFNQIEQTDINLNRIFELTVSELRLKLYNEYESMLKLMEAENLDRKVVQMIIGPVYDINKRDVEILGKYDLVYSGSDKSFECFSKYFEEYLFVKANDIDIWPLWGTTEAELRQIIKGRLAEKYGEHWESGFVKEFGDRRKVLMDSLIMIRERNRKAFGDRASNNLIDYTYPMDMFNGFIASDWKWYSQIFGTKSQSSDWSKKFDHWEKLEIHSLTTIKIF